MKIQNLNSFKKVQEPKETGGTFSENAKIKSKFGLGKFKVPCFADDSGFCVEALKNKPGVRSRRFLEKYSSNQKAFDYIISNVIKKKNNKAFFITEMALFRSLYLDNKRALFFLKNFFFLGYFLSISFILSDSFDKD